MLNLFKEENVELLSIQQAVCDIKSLIENAITNGGQDKKGNIIDGCQAKNNLIKSQVPICKLHDAVKSSFIELGVNSSYIKPPLLHHDGEVKIFGRLKAKNQDVCIFPNDMNQERQRLSYNG